MGRSLLRWRRRRLGWWFGGVLLGLCLEFPRCCPRLPCVCPPGAPRRRGRSPGWWGRCFLALGSGLPAIPSTWRSPITPRQGGPMHEARNGQSPETPQPKPNVGPPWRGVIARSEVDGMAGRPPERVPPKPTEDAGPSWRPAPPARSPRREKRTDSGLRSCGRAAAVPKSPSQRA